MRILLIEDEKRLADALEYILKKNHFVVDTAFDGISGQDMAESGCRTERKSEMRRINI